MATINCPNCGRHLRPGARFCGNCGATITTPPSSEIVAGPTVDTELIACPNCGKPVRGGAKFCTQCGKEIPQQVLNGVSVPPPIQVPGSAVTASESQNVALSSTGQSPVVRQASAVPASQKPKKRPVWAFLLVGLILLCLFVTAGAFFYIRDPLQMIRTPQPSLVAVVPAQTEVPIASSPVPITDTPVVETVQPSPTVENTPTETSRPTVVLTSTLQVSPTVLVSTTTAPIQQLPSAEIVLEDDFSENLNANWLAWGDPRPNLRQGFGDSWLDLKAADKPNEAGVTSRVELENGPGVRIEFEAQLNPGFPQFPLLVDWDPLQFDRGPLNTTPTVLHLEIRKSITILQAPAASDICQADVDGTVKHNFAIMFTAEKFADLYIDDNQIPLCHIDMGIKPVPGRISFTGNGWVTRILVTRSSAQ